MVDVLSKRVLQASGLQSNELEKANGLLEGLLSNKIKVCTSLVLYNVSF